MQRFTQSVPDSGVSFLSFIDTSYHKIFNLILSITRLANNCFSGLAYHVVRAAKSTAILAAIALLAGCGASEIPDASPLQSGIHPSGLPTLKVVATTTVLADLAANVGGDLVTVSTLVPSGTDVHSFQSTPADSLVIGEAGVIVSNGAGLDDFLAPIWESARQANSVHVVASQEFQALEPEQLEADPHFWLDPILTKGYVAAIRDGFIQADPENTATYEANSRDYSNKLEELDREITTTLALVPPERRHLVTFHDAYGHFARRYGWQISAFVASDASDVTPGDIVAVLAQVEQDGIPAVFIEPQFNSDVMRQASLDAGVKVGTLRSLVDGQANTYLEMMRANAESLAANLK